ncbi:helix-turn-helix domain-containing protein [Emticicia sp. BO119]|uniref:helix-turn-helix domain-containing protein n=1 Tax=Emticicia sp. BO119 TaxID=2757768 RepID=UPI0015F09312|nr:helix-turn-helix domain-containing protein [Emticicia sp. BO119]MBA4848757.1 helix-turn-helix domain-containing protein [Emticicia sp. BO119]
MDEERMNELQHNKGGRGITDYTPDYDEQAYNYCLLGATNQTLARFFGVSSTTVKKWMKKYPGFQESVRRGKELADVQVAGSLFKRAIGYTCQQVVSESVRASATNTESEKVTSSEKVTNMVGTFLNQDNDGYQKIRVTTKEIIPDTKAQIFWLKNRQPELWRDKRDVDHTSGGEKLNVVTIFELPNDGRND